MKSFFLLATIAMITVKISLITSLNILCSNPLNLKNKITKIEHKKIFRGLSKTLKNFSWPVNIWLKYFMTPTKTLCPSPSYILSVRSLISTNQKFSFQTHESFETGFSDHYHLNYFILNLHCTKLSPCKEI